MENNIDQTLRQWGRARQERLGDPDEETIAAVMRRVRQGAASPRIEAERARPQVFWQWAFSVIALASVAFLAVVVFKGVGPFPSPGPAPMSIVYEVRCEATRPSPEMREPVVQVARYEALFQEN